MSIANNSRQSCLTIFAKRLFKMVKVRGKGLGYVALQDIEPGTLLISDPPILVSTCQEVQYTSNMVGAWVKTRDGHADAGNAE